MVNDKTKEPTALASKVDVLTAIRHHRSRRHHTPESVDADKAEVV